MYTKKDIRISNNYDLNYIHHTKLVVNLCVIIIIPLSNRDPTLMNTNGHIILHPSSNAVPMLVLIDVQTLQLLGSYSCNNVSTDPSYTSQVHLFSKIIMMQKTHFSKFKSDKLVYSTRNEKEKLPKLRKQKITHY